MDTVISEPTQVNPTTAIKSTDQSKPSVVEMITEQSFRKYIPTGIKVRVNVPIARNTNRAIFAINVDGFIPQYNLGSGMVTQAYRNFFPVQSFDYSRSFVEIYQEQINLPIQSHYVMNRFFSGHVNVGIRATSNTSQTGTFMITQASTCLRNYYAANEIYTGLRFLNTSIEGGDYAVDSFILGDLSINRNWGITTVGKNILPKVDLAQKLDYMFNYQGTASQQNTLRNKPYIEQFAEDWLFFTPITNIPNQNGGQIDFEIYFDYSNVEFYMPMLPLLALPNLNTSDQILDYGRTFNNKNSSITRNDFVYGFRNTTTLLVNTDTDKYEEEEDNLSSKG